MLPRKGLAGTVRGSRWIKQTPIRPSKHKRWERGPGRTNHEQGWITWLDNGIVPLHVALWRLSVEIRLDVASRTRFWALCRGSETYSGRETRYIKQMLGFTKAAMRRGGDAEGRKQTTTMERTKKKHEIEKSGVKRELKSRKVGDRNGMERAPSGSHYEAGSDNLLEYYDGFSQGLFAEFLGGEHRLDSSDEKEKKKKTQENRKLTGTRTTIRYDSLGYSSRKIGKIIAREEEKSQKQ